MAEYKVQFEVFEGPLDLLLYLVKKEEVDIYQVNLTKIATQFLEYVEVMRQLDLEVAGEFLVMASTLMYIKSRELLPREQQATPENDEDGDDPRWELIRQLVEYKKFKDASALLLQKEREQENLYPRVAPRPDLDPAPAPRPEVSLFDLINALTAVLKRHQERDSTREIFADPWTVSEKIEALRTSLSSRTRLRFSELFAETTSRSEVVVTFLALLELIRLRQVVVMQDHAFGEIDILRAPEPTPEKPVADGPSSETAGEAVGTPASGADHTTNNGGNGSHPPSVRGGAASAPESGLTN